MRRARALGTALTQIIGEAAAQDPAQAGAATANAEGPVPLAGARTLSADARGFALRLLPYEISSRFQAIVSQARNAWIFTSATLAVGADFSHFADRLGLAQAVTLRLDSPFDFQRQALLYLPLGLPPPSDPSFNDAVVETARPLLEAAGGGAFVLFTSHRALRHAAQLLERQLSPELPLLVQGNAPREQLLRRFRSSGNAVLLGTASFWEGVDVQGPALRLVIIDKLPFASPEDPVVRSRIEHLKAQGLSPFKQYQLPEAVLALKQGVGRLIRSEQDHGVVVLCDPRVRERSYGRTFRTSLPPMRVTVEREVALQALAIRLRARRASLNQRPPRRRRPRSCRRETAGAGYGHRGVLGGPVARGRGERVRGGAAARPWRAYFADDRAAAGPCGFAPARASSMRSPSGADPAPLPACVLLASIKLRGWRSRSICRCCRCLIYARSLPRRWVSPTPSARAVILDQ